MKKYSKEHEWVELENGVARIGISVYAADELGDLTFVELPEVGQSVQAGEVLCVVESVKAASEVYCPVSGTVSEVNEAVEEEPGTINASAEQEGWICKMTDVDEAGLKDLMTAAEYAEFVQQA